MRHRLTRVAAATLTLALAAVVLGGCGIGRVNPPNLNTPATPNRFRLLRYPAAGVELRAPANWTVIGQKPPLVAVIASGPAVISLWRYPRSGAALNAPAQLRGAMRSLVHNARARDPTLKIAATGLTHAGADGAVIIEGYEQVAHQRRRVRSEHVYASGAELVLDEYAPPKQFPSVDRRVFSPVRKSLAPLRRGSSQR